MSITTKATIKDVARQAGVSTMTVTRAFRGDLVAVETRRRIMAAAMELDYHPNAGARILRGGKTMSVGILFSDPTHNTVVRRLSEVLLKRHYVSYIADTLGDPELTLAALQDFCSRRVEAIIMQYNAAYLPLLPELEQVPNLVLTTMERHLPLERDCCFYNVLQAYREILTAAQQAGRKNLWTLGRKTYIEIRHLFELQTELGIPLRHCETSAYPSAPQYANHAEALRDLLKSGERPDGILAMSDVAAAQAIRVLNEFKLKVPEDVFVVGKDNSELADFCEIPIASIDMNLNKVAEGVVSLALERLNNPALPPRKEFFNATFIPRLSAGISIRRQK